MKFLAKLNVLFIVFFIVVCIGHPCRKCPWGYYGEQCNETCTCGTELCHDVLGCVTAGEQLYKIFVI